MSLSLQDVEGIDRLETFLDKYDIAREDVCLVGGATLAVRGLRKNRDLDLCIRSNAGVTTGDVEPAGVEMAPNKYEHIGISDQDLFTNPKFHDTVDGYKVIRPELEYSHKVIRGWEKDRTDIELLEQYRDTSQDWDPALEREDYTPPLSHLIRRGFASLRNDGFRESIRHGVSYLRWHGPLPRQDSEYTGQPTTIPGKARMSLREDGLRTTLARGVRLVKLKEPTGLLDRYTRLRHKAKLGTLAERKLELRYPTATLLTDQYRSSSFSRLDIVVRFLAAEAFYAETSVPGIAKSFEKRSGITFLDELENRVEEYTKSGNVRDVQIGYDSSILDPNALAVALLDDPDSVPIRVTSGSGQPQFDEGWFRENEFSDEQRRRLEVAYSQLLYRSNALFPAILWPPAQEHFDEIVAFLREEKEVHFVEAVSIPDKKFGDFVWELYESQQDLDLTHIEDKIEKMADYPKNLMIIALEVPNPRIREGFSNEVLQVKERVRERFTPKILENDSSANLIIHSTDDYDHNKETWETIDTYTAAPPPLERNRNSPLEAQQS